MRCGVTTSSIALDDTERVWVTKTRVEVMSTIRGDDGVTYLNDQNTVGMNEAVSVSGRPKHAQKVTSRNGGVTYLGVGEAVSVFGRPKQGDADYLSG
jgi:hypothetical protein